jgi:ubiquinone/menaquinone biosynthesis C-methylase UbiE
MALLSGASRAKLDAINRLSNETSFSGDGAANYDQNHRYGEAEQHDHPCRTLIEEVWAPGGYGRALDLGAGSGYFTTMIARRATSVSAVELVPDMQRTLRERCAAHGLRNVEVIGASAADLRTHVADASIDSALVLQSLHHFHRRDEVFAALGAVVRPGGRLFLVEPHHNARRAARLFRAYLRDYRAPGFQSDPRNWATHDFLTRREIHALCRRGGFEDVRITAVLDPVRAPGVARPASPLSRGATPRILPRPAALRGGAGGRGAPERPGRHVAAVDPTTLCRDRIWTTALPGRSATAQSSTGTSEASSPAYRYQRVPGGSSPTS